jgi:hypothetical protein
VVDLVNDVLRKRKYFNPQGWETFGEALREANASFERPIVGLPLYARLFEKIISTPALILTGRLPPSWSQPPF